MRIIFSTSNNKIYFISCLVMLLVIGVGASLFTDLDKKSFFLNVLAQEFSESVTNSSSISISPAEVSSNNSTKQNESKTVMASGHFANNQMEDGTVTWIQGGLWNLEIDNSSKMNMENTNASATFDADFTMIRPDGSLSHNHVINNFTSTNVIFASNDIVITGISDINSNNEAEYEQVPITIHLMGKRVLGLMMDVNKTGGHFSGSNEMFGTLISGIGLDNSTSVSNSTVNGRMTADSNNTSNTNSMAHTAH